MDGDDRLPLVGRDGTLHVLADALDEAPGRARRVVVVNGEPLVGKTRLVDAACERAGRSAEVVRARRHEREQPGAALRRLSGGAQVVVIDDAQHLDEASLDALLEPRRAAHDATTLVLVFGWGLAGRTPGVRDLVARARAVAAAEFTVEPLDVSALAPLVASVGAEPRVLDPARLHARSAGLPGVAIPIIRAAVERGVEPSCCVDPRDDDFAFEAARAAIVAAIADVGEKELEAAKALSALLPGTWHDGLLEAVADHAGLPAAATRRAMDALLAEGVLVRQGRHLAFRRFPVHAALYRELGDVARSRLHDQAAAVLRQLRAVGGYGVGGVDAATHAVRAAFGSPEDVHDAAVAAAAYTFDEAPLTAAAWLTRAIEAVGPGDSRRGDLIALRAAALVSAGRLEEGVASCEEALGSASLDSVSRARASCALSRALIMTGQPQLALDLTTAARSQDVAHRGVVEVHHATALQHAGRFRESAAVARASLAKLGANDAWRPIALACEAHSKLVLGNLAEYRAGICAALDGCGSDRRSFVAILVQSGWYLALAGELHASAEFMRRAKSLTETGGLTTFSASLDAESHIIDWFRGDWDALDADAASTGEPPDDSSRLWNVANEALAAARDVERGHLATARQRLNRLSERAPPASPIAAVVDYAHIRMARVAGRADAALAAARAAVSYHWDELGNVAGAAPLVLELADLAADHGATPEAQAATRRLADAAHSSSLRLVRALALHAALVTSGDVDAGARACALYREAGFRWYEASATAALGAAKQDPDTLRRAYAIFEELNAEPSRRKVGARLRALGEPVPRRRRSHDHRSLPDLEESIARHAADGLTTAEIAAATALSTRTVSAYLTTIYRKFGVRSRTELANILRQDSSSSVAPR